MRVMSVLVALVLFSTAPASSQSVSAPNWEALGRKVVRQLRLRPGEKVITVAHPGLFEEILPHLRYEVMKAGGIDLGVLDVLGRPTPSSWDPEILQNALRPARAAFQFVLLTIDAAVMLPGTTPAHPAYGAMQDIHREGRARSAHLHWTEESAIPVPGHAIPGGEVMLAAYQRALLHSNCDAIGEVQRRFSAAMRRGEVRVTSPAGTDLRFRIGNRPVICQDGDASMARARSGATLIDREIELPCGAVRVAPVEESVEGTIVIPVSQWGGRSVEGLRLRFEKGRIVEVVASSGRDAVEADLARAGETGRGLREFALGFNPELAVPESSPWIPYFGYGAGVIRLSIGDNADLGGRLTGGYVKASFSTDGRVIVGDQEWVRDGKLLDPR